MAARFIKSAANFEGCPASALPEVGIVGRSNSGKSSLINALTKQKGLARVSQSPGKTELLNFFSVDNRYVLVDMPGYGYAARGHAAREAWGPMIEDYLQYRENLKGVILVVDVARDWSQQEGELVDWLAQFGVPVILAINKIDRLNQKEKASRRREYDAVTSVLDRVYTSAAKGLGVKDLERTIFEKLLRT